MNFLSFGRYVQKGSGVDTDLPLVKNRGGEKKGGYLHDFPLEKKGVKKSSGKKLATSRAQRLFVSDTLIKKRKTKKGGRGKRDRTKDKQRLNSRV